MQETMLIELMIQYIKENSIKSLMEIVLRAIETCDDNK